MQTRHPSARPCRAAALAMALLAALATGPPAAAQLRAPGRPASATSVLPAPAVLELSAPDVAAYRAEDERTGNWLYRYGALVPVGIGPENGGRLDAAEDGALVWRVELRSEGALSIGLVLDRFELPEGAELYVYDPGRELVLGAYTARNNKPNGQLQVQPVPGDTVVVEYVQPADVLDVARLRIGTLIHDYRGLLAPAGEVGGGGDVCSVGINCPQGAPYQDVKRAVARVLTGSGTLCSGALLNNTAENGRQLFLTANHCGSMDNAVFLFNYEQPGCFTGTAPQTDTVAGSSLLASSAVEDFRLIEITEYIPPAFDVYFAGFKTTPGVPASTFSIHHPDGGPKELCTDASPPTLSVVPYWGAKWDEGLIVGGSSGGPLFNGNGYVMGPACCIDNSICGSQSTFYGRMDLFWSDVAPWLDPLGAGPDLFPGLDETNPVQVQVTGASPTTMDAVTVDGPPVVDLFGQEFFTVSGITVDGIPLSNFPPDYSVLSDTHIQILNWPLVTKTGPVDVVLSSVFGQATVQIEVQANDPPVLDLKGSQSEGSFLFTASGLDVTMGSQPGDVHFLGLSGSSNPSVLPGYVSWGIGNNFAALYSGGVYTMTGKAWANVKIPVGPGLGGVVVHLQSAVWVAGAPVFPLTMSNVQSGQFLF